MSPRPIIRARGLTKTFGDFTAVDALDFEVRPGSIFAFLGANGSGKSTTIRMLIGLLRPTAGAIEVDGIDVVHRPRLVRDHVGYMSQRVSLYPNLSLRENLEFYAGLFGLAGGALEERWGGLRERFGLREAEPERAGDLPAGVRQRAGLALSTLHRPRVLFLDEPTAGVDVQHRALFWDVIQDEAAAGVTVFVTTHFLEEVEYCDWVCFIDAGRLIANGEPETIRRRYSDGYRVTIDLAPAARPGVLAALAALPAPVEDTGTGLRLQLPALTRDAMAILARVTAPVGSGRLHIEQSDMTRVFHRLVHEGANGAAGGGTGGAALAAGAALVTDAAVAAGDGPASPTAPTPGTLPPGGPRVRASWRRLRTLMQREVRATLRDRATSISLIAVPLAALLTFGSIVSTDVHRLPLAVHDASDTGASRRLIAELAATGSFAPRRYATRAALERALVSGAASVAIVVPPDFERALARARAGGPPPEIQTLYDGAETVLAANAEAALRSITAAVGAGLTGTGGRPVPAGAGADAPGRIRVVQRVLFNPDLEGTPFMVAGTYGFVLTFLTTLITAVSIVNERVSGTFEQLQVTPATSAEIVLGKVLPLGAVFALDVVLMVLAGGLILGVWPAGSTIFFVAVSSLYVVISLALGLIISATSATAAAAVQKTVLLSIPLIFLGGFLFPIRNLPLVFRWAAELFPATHYIRIARAIYLRAEGPVSLAGEIAMVTIMGAVLMSIAFRTVESRA